MSDKRTQAGAAGGNALTRWWDKVSEKHPKAAKWIREGGLFLIISYLVTFLKYLVMLFLPNLFGLELAANGWGWPNATFTVLGVTFTFNILGYAPLLNDAGEVIIGGGLGYCFAVWISIILGECINFPLQRKFTFNNHGPLSKQIPIYAVGVLVVNLALNAFNSVWTGLAQYLVAPWLYNIVTTVVAGGICMVVFFVIDKIIFAPGFGEPKSAH